jgi:hypothetical protein
MEDIVVEGLGHLQGQLSNPAEFFEAIQAVHEEKRDEGFDGFRSAFEAKGFGSPGEEFVRFVAENGGTDVLDMIAQERVDDLVAAYEQPADADSDDSGSVDSVDGGDSGEAWQAMLARYSDQWDGAEENWDAFQQYVLYYAEEGGLAEPATLFFARAANEDKIALFAEYGVTLEFDTAAADPSDALWQAAVESFGAAWAGWDGSAAGWAEYRDWFYSAANSQDPAMYAVVYERMDPLNALDLQERVAQLGELGFDVSGTQASESPEAAAAEEQLAEQAVEQIFEPALTQFEERLPELAAELGISVEELRAELADLPEDFLANQFTDELAG